MARLTLLILLCGITNFYAKFAKMRKNLSYPVEEIRPRFRTFSITFAFFALYFLIEYLLENSRLAGSQYFKMPLAAGFFA